MALSSPVVLATRPIALEYWIAPVGNILNELIEALLRWITENLPGVERARQRFDPENDDDMSPALDSNDATGRRVGA
ncbi:hypothetical protein [Arthrobacter cupressi]